MAVLTGLGCFFVSFLTSLYYNTVLTWVLWYLLNSFQHPLPWGACPLDLNRTGDVGPWASASPHPALRGHPQTTCLRSSYLCSMCLFSARPGACGWPVVHSALVGPMAVLGHGAERVRGCFC